MEYLVGMKGKIWICNNLFWVAESSLGASSSDKFENNIISQNDPTTPSAMLEPQIPPMEGFCVLQKRRSTFTGTRKLWKVGS